MIGRIHWINKDKLADFILRTQVFYLTQKEEGGIADRPEHMPDVFHTFFGICGLSLLGHPGLLPLSSAYCLPQTIIDKVVKK
jgi:geranylgeranyl transferase type-2 subunit beta